MPELPEVETVVRDLRPLVVAAKIARVRTSRHSLRRRWNRRWSRMLLGCTIRGIRRRGKWVVLDLDDSSHVLFHLGMSGRLNVRDGKDSGEPHTHVTFVFEDGRSLRLRDPRRFGCAVYLATDEALHRFFQGLYLGPEPFDMGRGDLRAAAARTRRNLKAMLLDQSVVAGVGNIYADETLFEARLHPALQANRVSPQGIDRLHRSLKRVLRQAIELRGSSIRDFLGGNGHKGNYQDNFRVYGREGLPCRRCSQPIQRIRLAGRSTFFCPNCQPRSSHNRNEPNES